jgi:hypothetical protein
VTAVNDKRDHIPPVVSASAVTFPFDIQVAGWGGGGYGGEGGAACCLAAARHLRWLPASFLFGPARRFRSLRAREAWRHNHGRHPPKLVSSAPLNPPVLLPPLPTPRLHSRTAALLPLLPRSDGGSVFSLGAVKRMLASTNPPSVLH